jgi:signal transduction histidine kinase
MKSIEWEQLCLSELFFFGKMTASVSHEIKNKLAIIKEQSGLASDLFAMAERGRDLDAAKIKNLVERMAVNVDAIDEIVKRLSRFAHSVDEPRRTFDVGELSLLLVGLCQRFAAMKKVRLTVSEPPYQVQITNNPFLLLRLLYFMIDRAMAGTPEGGKVAVAVRDAAENAAIGLSGDFPALNLGNASGLEPMLAILHAVVKETADPPGIELLLPKDLQDV